MISIFRGKRHHVDPSCRSDASDRAARGILHIPPAALIAAAILVDSTRNFGDLYCRLFHPIRALLPSLSVITPNAIGGIAISIDIAIKTE
eukprot:6189572-Pleurochrysis_carterae.AAC.1